MVTSSPKKEDFSMNLKKTDQVKTSEAGIFGRILSNSRAEMSPNLARYVLTLGFSAADQTRMQDLANRNQEGRLAPEEHQELVSYVGAGHLLALLHSKARKSLKKKKVS